MSAPILHALRQPGLDETRREGIDAPVKETDRKFGRVDVPLNCAAIFGAAPVIEIERDDDDRVFGINGSATVFAMQEVAPYMTANGVEGQIVNMARKAPPDPSAWRGVGRRLLLFKGSSHQHHSISQAGPGPERSEYECHFAKRGRRRVPGRS